MSAIGVIARNDLRLLARDRMGLFWALGFPLLMALFFGSLFGGGSGSARAIPVAIVDEDATPESQAFVARLTSSSALEADATLPLEEAKDRVRRGKLVAYVRVGKGFGAAFSPFGAQSPVEVGIDPARGPERGMLQGVLMASAFQAMQDRLADPASARRQVGDALASIPKGPEATGQDAVLGTFLKGLDTFLGDVDPKQYQETLSSATGGAAGGSDAGGEPFRMVEMSRDEAGQPRSPFDISFPSAVLWGVLGCSSTFALSMVRERLGGTLQRLRAAPLGRWEILAGKGAACFLACMLVLGLLLLFGRLAMGMRIGSAPLLLLAMAATSWCFTGLMMLLSVAGRTLSAVSGIGWGSNVAMAMIGGGMIPLAFMPDWLRTLSHVSPVKWGILALEGAIWRDFSIAEMAPALAVLVVVGTVAFAAGSMIESRREG